MKIVISNRLVLQDVPLELLEILKDRLSFTNPRWEENEKRGYSNWKTPQTLKFYDELVNGELELPRGFIRQLSLSLLTLVESIYQS